MSALAWLATVVVGLLVAALLFGAGYLTAAVALARRIEELERELEGSADRVPPTGDQPWET